ncbi:polysaccharide pyruvyl transferase family protein [Nesterenkonia sp. MY13]|uniref:Polysaccharide pyruvyl transferase family protein n=1 Tax=Nesterenkonia sedimenti TaxID=1463632 RepID=A0A7X8TLN4_9MICC|nr:polysaccharide pyruvyl transferase family protein [Nesterenkonia sedimenti]
MSTYPEHGSKNIGDFLITQSLIAMIRRLSKVEPSILTVWRGDSWEAVKDTIMAADHVFFACLAIRPQMGDSIYPFASKLVEHDVRFSVHAAGTDLRVSGTENLYGGLDEDTVHLLREVATSATEFTTRGVLTQEFCRQLGLSKSRFEGDLAFYEPGRHGLPVTRPSQINTILVSDPHRAPQYMESFDALISGLMRMFPKASIKVVLHGLNPEIADYCASKWIECEPIFEDPEEGLAAYERGDIHVGYRVHGHVTALKKRKPSYLLEQDGRGTDYGLTMSRRLTVPNYPLPTPVDKDAERVASQASVVAPQELLALVRRDIESGFERFEGLGEELTQYSQAAEARVEKVIARLSEDA